MQVEGIAAGNVRCGGRFQRDGCLTFKGNLRGQAEQRCHRVEEPARGGCIDRLDALRKHRIDKLELLGRGRIETRQVRKAPCAERVAQIAQGHAPGLADRRVTAGQRDVAQMRAPGELRVACDKEFAAPDAAVAAVARAVEGDANHLSAQVVLSHATGDVGVMMLNGEPAFNPRRERHARAPVSRMKIVGHCAWLYTEEALHPRQRLLEELLRLEVLKVADMLAQDGMASFGEAKRVLQLTAECDQFRHGAAEVDGVGDVSARAPQDAFAALEGAHHRIVDTHGDIAIVQEEPIDDAVKPPHRFAVRDHKRLFAQVAAGHDKCRELRSLVWRIAEQKVVQRSVRKHNADRIVAGCDSSGDRRCWDARHDDNGPPQMQQSGLIAGGDFAEQFNRGEVPHHQGEWLGGSLLAPAEFSDGCLVGRIAGQQKAAQTFDCQDFAFMQKHPCLVQSLK